MKRAAKRMYKYASWCDGETEGLKLLQRSRVLSVPPDSQAVRGVLPKFVVVNIEISCSNEHTLNKFEYLVEYLKYNYHRSERNLTNTMPENKYISFYS